MSIWGGGPAARQPPSRCAPANIIHSIGIYSTYDYNLARNLWEPFMEPCGSTALIVLSKRRKNKGYFTVYLTTQPAVQFAVPSGVVINNNKLQVSCGWKPSCSNLRYHNGICLKGLRKLTKCLYYDSWCPVQDSKLELTEHGEWTPIHSTATITSEKRTQGDGKKARKYQKWCRINLKISHPPA
jgi:hypothetical protein